MIRTIIPPANDGTVTTLEAEKSLHENGIVIIKDGDKPVGAVIPADNRPEHYRVFTLEDDVDFLSLEEAMLAYPQYDFELVT